MVIHKRVIGNTNYAACEQEGAWTTNDSEVNCWHNAIYQGNFVAIQ